MRTNVVYQSLSPIFRRRRMASFLAKFEPRKGTRILDVGGDPGFWADAPIEAHVVTLNLHPVIVRDSMRHRCTTVVGDGRNLEFSDGEFDIVFSNSVIEHLGTWEGQEQFAREVRRIGRQYWVQTPAQEFFFEPHLLTPCFHWLPRTLQFKLVRRCTVWGWLEQPSLAKASDVVAELRLLKFAEVRRLFPEGRVLRERICGLTKSYVAVG